MVLTDNELGMIEQLTYLNKSVAEEAALVAGIGGKVEHIPDVGTPQPLVAVKAAQHILVVDSLILLGVVAAVGVGAVQVRHTLGAVLTEAQRHDLAGGIG